MNQFKKGIDDIRSIQLSAEEKRLLREHIFSHPLPSPYRKPILFIVSRSWVSYGVATLVIVVLIGSSATYAAERSIPGDIFYPIKIKVTEPARDLLAQTPAARAQWESQKASRRLEEATALATHNELTPERSQEIEALFQKHVNAAAQALGTLSASDAHTTARDLEDKFDMTLAEHARTLRTASQSTDRQSSTTETRNRNKERGTRTYTAPPPQEEPAQDTPNTLRSSTTATSTAIEKELPTESNHDTSSLEKKVEEARKQLRTEELRTRSERNGEERERDRNISDHNRSPRQESERVK